MTERLYYRDSDLLSFDATAIAHGSDDRHLILDRSAFYPTSGGQPHDTGTLNGVRVLDVIDEEHRVVHRLEAALPLGAVRGEIDAARRHDHMQQHTAQHLISALAADRFGWETASVHFGAESSTIEFDTGTASAAQLQSLESEANRVVAAATPVTIAFENAATAAGLRKATAREGEIRVITIAGLDRSACGGTHVTSTAAIGAIVLHGVERVRGHCRVGFLAGDRVRTRCHAREALLGTLAESMSCAVDELATILPKRQLEIKTLRAQVELLEREVADGRLLRLIGEAPADATGIRRVRYRSEADSATLLRLMTQQAAGIDHLLFVATSASPPAVYFASGEGTGVDAGAALKTALAAVGGRGGGSPRAAQGTVPVGNALAGVVEQLLRLG